MAMEGSLSPSERTKPILDESSGVVRLVREQPPQHCILKVNSLSMFQDAALSNSEKDFISSTEFKAGGYTCCTISTEDLIVHFSGCYRSYPKGNKQEDGDGHISLYVTLVDKLDSGTTVNAVLRFYIYDQIRDNYIAFLDVSDKCFHALKTTWGIPKLMPPISFTNASYGFLVNDCCVFGAEVLVRDGQMKLSTMSRLEPKCDMIYTWKIENFSDVNNHLFSPVFTFGEWSWKLSLYPRRNEKTKGKYLSLGLILVNAKKLTHGSKLYTQYCLCIKNQGHGVDQKLIDFETFHSEAGGWKYTSFLSISDLYNTSEGFLVNDTLIAEVKIEKMLLLKD